MRTLAALSLLALAACTGETATPEAQAAPSPAAEAAATFSTTPLAPDADGEVITVKMMTAPDGANVFEPAAFEARKGDVLHFVLESGVHNVNFIPDSNAAAASLPKASDMLQLPGQSLDVRVAWDAGSYFFQCDPHALLGMVGRVTVK